MTRVPRKTTSTVPCTSCTSLITSLPQDLPPSNAINRCLGALSRREIGGLSFTKEQPKAYGRREIGAHIRRFLFFSQVLLHSGLAFRNEEGVVGNVLTRAVGNVTRATEVTLALISYQAYHI